MTKTSIYGAILGWNYQYEPCKAIENICGPIVLNGTDGPMGSCSRLNLEESSLLNKAKIISYIPLVSLIAAIFWREIPKTIATDKNVTRGERACFFVRYGISLLGGGSLFLIVDFIGYMVKTKDS